MRLLPPVLLAGAAFAVAGCGGGGGEKAPVGTSAPARAVCPQEWVAGWQRLADDVGVSVYCPSWMPSQVDGKIGGRFANGRSIDADDRSYLVSFLWVDRDVGGISAEVHVNFRGYPGVTKIPTCRKLDLKAGEKVETAVPCFSDVRGRKRIGRIDATIYTVNQDADQWHVLYAWRREGTLYTLSEHVARPYASTTKVMLNLDRMMRSLALVEPRA